MNENLRPIHCSLSLAQAAGADGRFIPVPGGVLVPDAPDPAWNSSHL